mgnify:CR=1 FL=1
MVSLGFVFFACDILLAPFCKRGFEFCDFCYLCLCASSLIDISPSDCVCVRNETRTGDVRYRRAKTTLCDCVDSHARKININN